MDTGQCRHKVTISEMDCQFISIYGHFVTSQTAYYSYAGINNHQVAWSTRNQLKLCYETCIRHSL